MALDCLVIGHNVGGHRLGRRARWLNEQHATPADVPADLGYVAQALESMRFGDEWIDPFDVMNRSDPRGGGHDPLAELPNHACLLLAAYLRRRGMSVNWVNSFDSETERLATLLRDQDPLVTCISTTLVIQPGAIVDMIEFVRAHNPETKIVLGGPYMWNLHSMLGGMAFPSMLGFLGADFCVLENEGEKTLAALIAALKAGRAPRTVPNLYFRDGRRFAASERIPEANSMEDLTVDWRLFTREELGPMVWMRTALSCAFKCSFCDFPARMGELRVKPIEQVEQELQSLEALGVTTINFIDDTFNVPVERFHELLNMMVRNRFGFRWMSYFRLANVKGPETFDLLAESGCESLYLGIESGDPAVLRNMVKGAPISRYRDGIAQLNKRGIMTQASFVAGFPGETRETVMATLRFVEETEPTFFHALPFYYNVNAPVHGQREKFQLTGRGFTWQHATMNSVTAHGVKELMFRAVARSRWIPDSFEIWSVPFLRAKGVSKADAIELVDRFRDLIAQNDETTDGVPRGDAIVGHVDRFIERNGLPDRKRVVTSREESLAAIRRIVASMAPPRVSTSRPDQDAPWLATADARIDAHDKFHTLMGRAWLDPRRWPAIDERAVEGRREQLEKMRDSMLTL